MKQPGKPSTAKKSQQRPSAKRIAARTYAAREARGRPLVTLSLSLATRDLLDRVRLASVDPETGRPATRSEIVTAAICAEAQRRGVQ